jgi:hypothetical protein
LQKQVAADNEQATKEENERKAEKERQRVRAEVKATWTTKLLPALEQSVAQVNQSLQGKRRLCVISENLPNGAMLVDELTLTFETKATPSLLTSKCAILVHPDGKIIVSMENRDRMAKSQQIDALAASADDVASVVLDYWERDI